jgi:phenylpropionate dioxygenase-like ring-hydroxylating dioxygenase large terminal subunit
MALLENEPLASHWFPVALATELRAGGKPFSATVLAVPVVVRRLGSGALRAFVDACPHRGIPLSSGFVDGELLRCPYHGWGFDASGTCVDIPGCAGAATAARTGKQISLKPVSVEERNGVIWVQLEPDSGKPLPVDEDSKKRYFFQGKFDVGLDDLIENFADPLHTRFVHTGIIRQSHLDPIPRKVRYTVDDKRILIEHEEKYDEIGPLRVLANPTKAKLRHYEIIRFPNYIILSYEFVGTPRYFVAELMLSPVSKDRTNLFVALSFNVGFLTPLARLLIPFYARSVIRQDERILGLLGKNLRTLEGLGPVTHYTSVESERHYDELRRRMKLLRQGRADPSVASGEFEISL